VRISVPFASDDNATMQDTYVIIWIARDKDRSGIGKRRLTKKQAEALAEELNLQHQVFLHRALDTATEDPAAALLALRESLSRVSGKLAPLPELGSMQAADVEVPVWGDARMPDVLAPAKRDPVIEAA
jgi:hypothetical protein